MKRIADLFERLLHIKETDAKVADMKREATDLMSETARVMAIYNVKQTLVIKKTTTFYIARAAGRIS